MSTKIITKYILFNIIFFEFINRDNCHYTELKLYINNIIRYMKKSAIHHKNNILPDNIELTRNILEEIKRNTIKIYRCTIYP